MSAHTETLTYVKSEKLQRYTAACRRGTDWLLQHLNSDGSPWRPSGRVPLLSRAVDVHRCGRNHSGRSRLRMVPPQHG